MKKNQKRASWKFQDVVSLVRFAPYLMLCIAPAVSSYATYKGTDPLTFILYWIPDRILPRSGRILVKIFSFVNLTLACITSSQILLGAGIVLTFAVYVHLRNLKLVESYSRERCVLIYIKIYYIIIIYYYILIYIYYIYINYIIIIYYIIYSFDGCEGFCMRTFHR